MKKRDLVEIRESGPKVFAVVRIVSDQCWLVKKKRARVGEEFFLSPRDPIVVAGPVKSGLTDYAIGWAHFEPGDLDYWEFMEYRVAFNGTTRAWFPPEPRTLSKKKEKS